MGLIKIWVHDSLQDNLESIRKQVAEEMKKQYDLKEVTIAGTVASQIAANKLRGNSIVRYRIKKVGKNKGILELL